MLTDPKEICDKAERLLGKRPTMCMVVVYGDDKFQSRDLHYESETKFTICERTGEASIIKAINALNALYDDFDFDKMRPVMFFHVGASCARANGGCWIDLERL